MNIMLCFEVEENLQQVREELASRGYMSSWKTKRGRDIITYYLPSNIMWKKGDTMSPSKAKEDLKKACSDAGTKSIRAVAMLISKWDGITGAPIATPGSESESGNGTMEQMAESEETSNKQA